MALGKQMSSSTTTTDTPSTTFAAAPTQTQQTTQNDGGMNRGASYFFGFLITFIALLVLFIACGVGSRRRLRRRGVAGGIGANAFFAPWELGAGSREMLGERPRMWDVWVREEKGSEKGETWGEIHVSYSTPIHIFM